MADLNDSVFAAATEPFRSEPSLTAEVAASSRGNTCTGQLPFCVTRANQ